MVLGKGFCRCEIAHPSALSPIFIVGEDAVILGAATRFGHIFRDGVALLVAVLCLLVVRGVVLGTIDFG
jgi:hypothetical protein